MSGEHEHDHAEQHDHVGEHSITASGEEFCIECSQVIKTPILTPGMPFDPAIRAILEAERDRAQAALDAFDAQQAVRTLWQGVTIAAASGDYEAMQAAYAALTTPEAPVEDEHAEHSH